MSEENLEIARRMIDAYNSGDVRAFVDLTTADFEWSTSMEPSRVLSWARGHRHVLREPEQRLGGAHAS